MPELLRGGGGDLWRGGGETDRSAARGGGAAVFGDETGETVGKVWAAAFDPLGLVAVVGCSRDAPKFPKFFKSGPVSNPANASSKAVPPAVGLPARLPFCDG